MAANARPPPQRRLYASSLYHERQRRMHCALHAVNNLLQRAAFDPRSFDAIIAEKLPPIEGALFNPYKSSVPLLGYYDASVVVCALMSEGIETQQHDARKPLTAADLADLGAFGIVVNIRSPGVLKAMVRALRLGDPRHWLSVVPLADGAYAWIDSLDSRPETLSAEALLARLNSLRTKDQAAIYLCRATELEKEGE